VISPARQLAGQPNLKKPTALRGAVGVWDCESSDRIPFEQIGLRTNVPQEALPDLTWRVLELTPDVVSTGSVLLGGIWWITNRRGEVARTEGRRK